MVWTYVSGPNLAVGLKSDNSIEKLHESRNEVDATFQGVHMQKSQKPQSPHAIAHACARRAPTLNPNRIRGDTPSQLWVRSLQQGGLVQANPSYTPGLYPWLRSSVPSLDQLRRNEVLEDLGEDDIRKHADRLVDVTHLQRRMDRYQRLAVHQSFNSLAPSAAAALANPALEISHQSISRADELALRLELLKADANLIFLEPDPSSTPPTPPPNIQPEGLQSSLQHSHPGHHHQQQQRHHHHCCCQCYHHCSCCSKSTHECSADVSSEADQKKPAAKITDAKKTNVGSVKTKTTTRNSTAAGRETVNPDTSSGRMGSGRSPEEKVTGCDRGLADRSPPSGEAVNPNNKWSHIGSGGRSKRGVADSGPGIPLDESCEGTRRSDQAASKEMIQGDEKALHLVNRLYQLNVPWSPEYHLVTEIQERVEPSDSPKPPWMPTNVFQSASRRPRSFSSPVTSPPRLEDSRSSPDPEPRTARRSLPSSATQLPTSKIPKQAFTSQKAGNHEATNRFKTQTPHSIQQTTTKNVGPTQRQKKALPGRSVHWNKTLASAHADAEEPVSSPTRKPSIPKPATSKARQLNKPRPAHSTVTIVAKAESAEAEACDRKKVVVTKPASKVVKKGMPAAVKANTDSTGTAEAATSARYDVITGDSAGSTLGSAVPVNDMTNDASTVPTAAVIYPRVVSAETGGTARNDDASVITRAEPGAMTSSNTAAAAAARLFTSGATAGTITQDVSGNPTSTTYPSGALPPNMNTRASSDAAIAAAAAAAPMTAADIIRMSLGTGDSYDDMSTFLQSQGSTQPEKENSLPQLDNFEFTLNPLRTSLERLSSDPPPVNLSSGLSGGNLDAEVSLVPHTLTAPTTFTLPWPDTGLTLGAPPNSSPPALQSLIPPIPLSDPGQLNDWITNLEQLVKSSLPHLDLDELAQATRPSQEGPSGVGTRQTPVEAGMQLAEPWLADDFRSIALANLSALARDAERVPASLNLQAWGRTSIAAPELPQAGGGERAGGTYVDAVKELERLMAEQEFKRYEQELQDHTAYDQPSSSSSSSLSNMQTATTSHDAAQISAGAVARCTSTSLVTHIPTTTNAHAEGAQPLISPPLEGSSVHSSLSSLDSSLESFSTVSLPEERLAEEVKLGLLELRNIRTRGPQSSQASKATASLSSPDSPEQSLSPTVSTDSLMSALWAEELQRLKSTKG